MANTYTPVSTSLTDFINKSQYFNPFFSFLTISYIYFAIGIRSDTIWKYLFHVVNCAFFANLFSMAKKISINLNYFHFEYFRHLVWIETIFFGLNEWGFVFINFVKIKSCIKTLKSKIWSYIMWLLLIYTLIIRFVITYFELIEEQEKINGEKKVKEVSVKFHSLLYLPMGILEFIFLFLILKNLSETQDKKYRNVLNILLHSSLSRMFIVSFLLFSISIIVWFPNEGIAGLIRRFLWRLKGYLGIIFLVDLLLLRIEIDDTKIKDCNDEIKRINKSNSVNNYQQPVSLVSAEGNYYSKPSSPLSPYLSNRTLKTYNEDNNIFKNVPELQYSDRSRDTYVNSSVTINRSRSNRIIPLSPTLNKSYKNMSMATSPSNRSSSYLPKKTRRNSNISNIITDYYLYNDETNILKPEYPVTNNNRKSENEIGRQKSLIEETNKLFR